ncbi:MAG: UPF0149 family protein [Hyphomicrobiaceae bacterium]|nr:UPF0149 family protein [Hyphomicrobiaceae bacterium]
MLEQSRDELIKIGLEELNHFLISDDAPENCMMLSELDGFLTAIAVGPELIMPSEWMPAIWRDEQPIYDDLDQAQQITGIITDRYNTILDTVSAREPSYAPVFLYHPSGHPMPDAWAQGFWSGMELRFEAWLPLLENMEDEDVLAMMIPIHIFVKEDDKSIFDFPEEELQKYAKQSAGLIPMSVVAINQYWQKQRAQHVLPKGTPVMARKTPKVGRNDPCPCGSGKKYKKCCLN